MTTTPTIVTTASEDLPLIIDDLLEQAEEAGSADTRAQLAAEAAALLPGAGAR